MEVRHWTAMTPCSTSERPRAARTRRARGEDDEGNDPAYLTRPALTPHPACQVACAREGSAALSPPRPDVWPAHATDGRLRAVYGRKRGGGPTVEGRVHSDVFRATARRNRACTTRGRRSSEMSSARSGSEVQRQHRFYFVIQFSKLRNSKMCQHTRKSPKIKVV
jgi:hypothetical protein